MTKPVLVTGAAGYIGSHTAKLLAGAGYLPIAVDDLGRGFRDAVRWGPLEQGSTLDRDFLDGVIERWKPEAVLHFAAFAYVGESVGDPGLYYRNNTMGTLSLLEACRDHGIEKLVFSSTCATYGVPARIPITEDLPQTPINPYGASKLMVERMLADFSTAHGLRSVILRYFNAAGTDPEGEIGEHHSPQTRLIPLAVEAALGHGPALNVFGTDYDTPDGTCLRDYVHVNDLGRAHLQALAYLEAGGASTACNLGTGTAYSVREIIDAVGRAVGSPVPVVYGPRRAGDPPTLVADASLARSLLGWTPTESDLDTITRTAVAWARRKHNQAAG